MGSGFCQENRSLTFDSVLVPAGDNGCAGTGARKRTKGFSDEGLPLSHFEMSPERPQARSLRRQIPAAAGAFTGDRLDYAPPIADWLAFLAELLAAEFLREIQLGGDPD